MGTSCSICVALSVCKAMGNLVCVALSGGVKQWVHLVLCVWHVECAMGTSCSICVALKWM